MHRNKGRLRAYLDKEMPAEEARKTEDHLSACAACREHLETLRRRSETTASALASLAEPKQGAQTSPYVAFARFQDRVQDSKSERSAQSMWNQLTSGRWRAAWAGLTALVVLSLFVFYPPLRTAAADFLGIFRVRKFAAVPINISALENPTFANVLETAFSDQVKVLREPGPSLTVNSAQEATALLGFEARLPSRLPDGFATPPALNVEDGMAFQVTVNVEYVKSIRDALGKADVPIPANLNGARVDVNVPKILTAFYASNQGPFTLAQAKSPEIQVPPNVDLTQLGEFGLRLAGMPADQAAQMAAAIDWANTLIVPIPMGYATYEEVSVAGSQGLVVGEASGTGGHWLLAFEKDGIVYGLEGPLSAEELIAIAESMF